MFMVMTTLNRPEQTRQAIDSFSIVEGKPKLIVVDNGSDPETLSILSKKLLEGKIYRLILNSIGSVPQWQKCFSIRQAWDLVKDLEENFTYFGWLDNDFIIHPNASRVAAAILASEPNIHVVSCHQDERQEKSHKTVFEKNGVRYKKTANGACWIFRKSFFGHFGLPPVYLGKCEAGVEDWFYSRKFQKDDECRFAIINGGIHIGYDCSVRLTVPHGRP